MINFETIEYMKTGNPRQQEVYQLLIQSRIMDILKEFTPVLAGTIPINIDIPGSDLDIICCWDNKEGFKNTLMENFQEHKGFQIDEKEKRGHKTIIARFMLEGYGVEVFGQNRPATQQEAYRHMVIEHKILQQKGEQFRQEIVKLKMEGYKTEPAFGVLLGLGNNPYKKLLQMGLDDGNLNY